MNKRLLLVYHGNCDDGFGAAWACHQAEITGRLKTFWPDGVDYFKGVYGLPAPDCAGRDVVLVDFCYPAEVMEQMIAEAKSVLVLDHHVSAQKMMIEHAQGRTAARWDVQDVTNHDGGPMVRIKLPNGAMEFDMGRSGAAMAWDHFMGKTHWPNLIKYVQDRDLWTKKLPHIDAFTMALRSLPMEFSVWDQVRDQVEYGAVTNPDGFAKFVAPGPVDPALPAAARGPGGQGQLLGDPGRQAGPGHRGHGRPVRHLIRGLAQALRHPVLVREGQVHYQFP